MSNPETDKSKNKHRGHWTPKLGSAVEGQHFVPMNSGYKSSKPALKDIDTPSQTVIHKGPMLVMPGLEELTLSNGFRKRAGMAPVQRQPKSKPAAKNEPVPSPKEPVKVDVDAEPEEPEQLAPEPLESPELIDSIEKAQMEFQEPVESKSEDVPSEEQAKARDDLARSRREGEKIIDPGTPLLRVLWYSGHPEEIKKILEEDRNAVNDRDNLRGSPAIKLAAQWLGSGVELMKILVEYGADVNSINKDGENALMTSVESGNTDCLQYLLAQGADPNHRDVIGVAPIHIVCKRGDLEELNMLVAAGADVNVPTQTGATPLMIAVQAQQFEIVRRLIELGADVNLPTQSGATPLLVASQLGFQALAEFLLANGADANAQTRQGLSPLYVAASSNHPDIVRLLLERGRCAVDQRTVEEATPLFVACQVGNPEVVRLLLQHAADWAASVDGLSPLAIARACNHWNVVQAFDEHETFGWEKDEDAPDCRKCKASFSFFTRRHHCRNCGKVFCNTCSSKACLVPKLGFLARPLRVCVDCFDQLNPNESEVEEALSPRPLSSSSSDAAGGSSAPAKEKPKAEKPFSPYL